jgi:hypothetical protein
MEMNEVNAIKEELASKNIDIDAHVLEKAVALDNWYSTN